MPTLIHLLRRFGVDRAIAYTVIGRSWNVVSGAVTLLLIARFLSPEEQGFYYTFGSVIGLQVLFELGLGFVIFQYASHEKAKLEWTEAGCLVGDAKAYERLFSLLRKALLWYAALAVLVCALLIPGGLIFFGKYEGSSAHIGWQLPWIWAAVATAASLLVTPLVAVLEGAGRVAEVALVRTAQFVIGSLLTWAVLAGGGGLAAAPISNTVVFLVWIVWLVRKQAPFVKQALAFDPRGVGIDWRREVWPFQWRIALSGISSYFIFLLFTPVLFMFHGAAAAGQMGMSMAVMSAVAGIAAAWISTKLSPFGILIAQRDFRGLDELFFPALWKSVGILVFLSAILWLAVNFLYAMRHPLSGRLLPPVPLMIFMGTTVINHIVGIEAMYLRAHKEEPFLLLSVVVAVLTALSTYFLGKTSTVTAMLLGNFAITLLFSLCWGTAIFVKKRQAWHDESATLVATS